MNWQDKLRQILEQGYSDKNFVQRILYPQAFPSLDLGNGWHATHKMSYSTVGDKTFAYPNVIYDQATGMLKELQPQEALHHALLTGEHIPFKSEKTADWFTKNYKELWK